MRKILIGLILAAGACSGPADDTAQPANGPVERGQAIAEANCASCHAIDATSASPHDEAPAFRTLSQRYPVSSLQEALAEGIVVGHEDMPEFTFSPEEVDALIAFMESLQPEDD